VGTLVGGPLGAMLLGAAYQLNLVRTAEEVPSGRRVVQLTPLGRYLLALGPPPPPPPAYEHFLFVQPSFEVIAYRQGLTPPLVGRFSRFAVWTQVGAALAMRLTPESVYRGLEGGLTAQAMRDQLQRHSPRPLPAGVTEALRTWAGRRERVTYHASATLVEFATPDDLERALRHWPADDRPAPLRVSDRLVLVEDERSIPFQRFRLTGSRSYRTPPDACVEVEPDGVTINGWRFANSATVACDSQGRPLSHVPWGVRHVNAGEVWLFGFKDAHSWDSRYYGPLPLGAVRWVVTPVLTLGASEP